MDLIIKACFALLAFIVTAWHIYISIEGLREAKKHPDAKFVMIIFSILTFGFAVLIAWLGALFLR